METRTYRKLPGRVVPFFRALGIDTGGVHNPKQEFKYQGPDGVVIDISSVGWEGTEG